MTPGREEASKYAALSQQLGRREEKFQASMLKTNGGVEKTFTRAARGPACDLRADLVLSRAAEMIVRATGVRCIRSTG